MSRQRPPAGGAPCRSVGGRSTSDNGDDVARHAKALGKRFQRFGRIGWLAKGLIYGLMGVLALNIALNSGGSGEEANSLGAVSSIARQPIGEVLVIVVAVGLALYVLWRFFSALLPGDWTGKALVERAGYLVSGVVYATLSFTILRTIRQGGRTVSSEREDQMVHDWVGKLMSATAGRWLVGLVALVVAGIAASFFHKAFTRSFEEDLTFVPDDARHSTIVRLGQLGWSGRAISMALIAFFLLRAAVTFDPDEVGGIDGSMRRFTQYSWGPWVVALTGVGFVAYGLFCVISAKFQLLRGPHND